MYFHRLKSDLPTSQIGERRLPKGMFNGLRKEKHLLGLTDDGAIAVWNVRDRVK
jgi:hypothetical protein